MPTPLTKGEKRDHKDLGRVQAYGILAATQIFKGGAVALDAAGFAVPAINTAAFIVVGIAQQDALGSAVNGEVKVNCRLGVYAFIAEGGDVPTQARVGRAVYAASDNEVELTAGAAVIMGKLEEIDANGVDFWVNIFDQAVA